MQRAGHEWGQSKASYLECVDDRMRVHRLLAVPAKRLRRRWKRLRTALTSAQLSLHPPKTMQRKQEAKTEAARTPPARRVGH